jgi:uncharacterized membrane protein
MFIKSEEERIIAAIGRAEQRTTGEIRVHVAKKLDGNVLEAAVRTFTYLKMHETTERNGVIIYIVPSARQFAIWGDSGIHKATDTDFWTTSAAALQVFFKKGLFCDGVCAAIDDIADILTQHFPLDGASPNELSNDISYE